MSTPQPTTAVTADLRLAVDGFDVRITGAGRVLVVDLPSLRAGAALLRAGPFQSGPTRRLVQVHRGLRVAGLTAEIRIAGRPLARLGCVGRPGVLGRFRRTRK